MIAENREQVENTRDYYAECTQALMSYLRQEASYEMLQNNRIHEAMKRRLIIKAKDWAIKNEVQFTEDEYKQLAENTLATYLVNWQDKIQGEDNRGKRLGKSHYLDT